MHDPRNYVNTVKEESVANREFQSFNLHLVWWRADCNSSIWTVMSGENLPETCYECNWGEYVTLQNTSRDVKTARYAVTNSYTF